MPWVAASYGLQLAVQKWHLCRQNGKEAVMHPYQKQILAMGSNLGRKELAAFKQTSKNLGVGAGSIILYMISKNHHGARECSQNNFCMYMYSNTSANTCGSNVSWRSNCWVRHGAAHGSIDAMMSCIRESLFLPDCQAMNRQITQLKPGDVRRSVSITNLLEKWPKLANGCLGQHKP